MAQSLNHLPCTHETLSLTCHTPEPMGQGGQVYGHNLSSVQVERRQEEPYGFLATQPI